MSEFMTLYYRHDVSVLYGNGIGDLGDPRISVDANHSVQLFQEELIFFSLVTGSSYRF